MALTVDWVNRIVHIPQSDLVSTANPNVYTLDIETFRWWVLDMMDSDEGMVNPDIINHNTSVTLSGITYARFIEIINGYTIEFEDIPANSYGVILSGANHNIIDVNRFNTTSLLGNNSAGLIYNDVGSIGDVNVTAVGGVSVSQPSDIGPQPDIIASEILNTDVALFTNNDTVGQAIWRSRFLRAAIYVDTSIVSNGDGSQEKPFNNIGDAFNMSDTSNIDNIIISGNVILPDGLQNMNIFGVGLPEIDLNGQDATGAKLEKVKVKGTYVGNIEATDCELMDGFTLSGHFHSCYLQGDLFVRDSTLLATCMSGVPGLVNSTISLDSGTVSSLSVSGWRGGLTIKDSTNINNIVTIEMAQGSLLFEDTNTQGTLVARGLGKFIDESTGALVIDEMTYEDDINNYTLSDGRKTRNTVIAN